MDIQSNPVILHRVNSPKLSADACALAIGSFDGVHLGHQEIIRGLLSEACRRGLKSRVLTFFPRPSEFFAPDRALPSIMSWREKVTRLAESGVDEVLCVPFNRRFAQISASDFVDQVLGKELNTKLLMVGEDFRFGASRLGDINLLKQVSASGDFELVVSPTIVQGAERISSTLIRKALLADDLDLAAAMLGRPYSLTGKVVKGNQLGRTLGVPTANLALKRDRLCVGGVFVGFAWVEKKKIPAVINIGYRPAVDKLVKPILEAHLLQFQGDLYGRYMTVELCQKLRPEAAFESLESLKQQIKNDIQQAEHWHETNAQQTLSTITP